MILSKNIKVLSLKRMAARPFMSHLIFFENTKADLVEPMLSNSWNSKGVWNAHLHMTGNVRRKALSRQVCDTGSVVIPWESEQYKLKFYYLVQKQCQKLWCVVNIKIFFAVCFCRIIKYFPISINPRTNWD